MTVLRRLFSVQGITAMVLLFITYKSIMVAINVAAFLQTTLAVG